MVLKQSVGNGIKVISSTTKTIGGNLNTNISKNINSISGGVGQTRNNIGASVGSSINNININTSSIANAMTAHNQAVINSINSHTNNLRTILSKNASDTLRETRVLQQSLREQTSRNSQNIEKVILEQGRISDNKIEALIKGLGTSLENINKDEPLTEDRTKNLSKAFWESLFDIFQNNEEFSSVIDFLFPQLSALSDSLDIAKYLGRRIQDFNNALEKLSKGEYQSLDDLLLDLSDSKTSADGIDFILSLLGLVPLAISLFQASYAKEYVALNRLALREGEPNIPTWQETMSGVRRGIFGYEKAIEMMRNSGWSENDAMLLFEMSKNQPIFTELAELFRRGLIEEKLLDRNLEALGYTPEWADLIKNLVFYVPTPQDVIRFSARDVFDEELASLSQIFEGWDNPDYLNYTRQAGIKDEDARLYWGAHWILPSVQQGYEMLFRQQINMTELQALFRAADIAPAWREKLLAIAYRVPTRVDTRNMFIEGVINEQETLDIIKAQGYNERNANFLLNWYKGIKAKRNDQTEDIKTLSLSVILKSVKAGILSDNDAIQRLVQLGYQTQDAALLLLLNNSEQALDNEVEYLDRELKRIRNIVENAYRDRTIPKQEAKDRLMNTGLNSVQSDSLIALLDIEYELNRKTVIVEQAKKLYIGYEWDANDYRASLINQGFTGQEIEAQLESLSPFREFRYRDLTTAQLLKAVKSDIISYEVWFNQMRGNGYSDNDIEILARTEGIL